MICKIKKSWIKLEKEHTTSDKIVKKIVGDHLREFGCGYYPALIKMERRLKK